MIIYQNRRQKLLEQLEDDNAVVIISTNSEQIRNGDVHYPFRAHSDFYYLTGFTEPEAVAVFSRYNYTIFLRPKDQQYEIWNGERLGVENAPDVLKADNAYAINLLTTQLPKIIINHSVYFDSKNNQLDVDAKIMQILTDSNPKSYTPCLHEMRLIKDSSEINLIQKAANISAQAHTLAMQNVNPGMFEFEIQSIFDEHFTKHNTQHAYMPIIAGGENACILHYTNNNKILNNNNLVLIDAGCEFAYYASDITRTFPINGKFSKPQKQIYNIVFKAQLAAIKSIKPGISVRKPHKVASSIIKKGLIKLGILEPDGDLLTFYMHNTAHWLGLDVHDVGKYQQNNIDKTFKIGMVTTIEPGIYIRKHDKINPIYHNIGIRIEDDILVTKTGNTVLTGHLTKTIDEIESLMNH